MAWIVFLSAFLLLLARAYRNTFHPNLNRVSITIKRAELASLPVTEPLRILHLSDLHMENISISAERIVEDWRSEPIDLIAITGDFLDRTRSIPKALAFVKTLQSLQPQIGIYAVFGNHDYVLPPKQLERLKRGLESLGCRVLQNETETHHWNGTKLQLIGVDDYATRRSDLAKSFANVDDDGIKLVLTHDPNVVLAMKAYEYDYLLSGHFHGGQIHWPKPYHLIKMGKLPKMNMVKGLHYHHNRPFYISEGLGQTGVNVRLRSRPEVTLHTLAIQHKSAAQPVGEAAVGQWESVPALAAD
ncbi:metallophosphoesterase [Brevibacillus humidisoli]|uniref:metallophosphoesterase n=1 Tax=Brevibacillus humidisoli TaxID=2895522 RepID=UPI001E49D504|nr:metallophosphoesterase [Brevibacillus humidisoli]UFJ43093.1 metallophosphoesterase [Brevibacillus humidisoli]